LTQGTVIMYFPCPPVRAGEIRGRQTAAEPDTTHPTWGGSGGGGGGRPAASPFLVFHHFKSVWTK